MDESVWATRGSKLVRECTVMSREVKAGTSAVLLQQSPKGERVSQAGKQAMDRVNTGGGCVCVSARDTLE